MEDKLSDHASTNVEGLTEVQVQQARDKYGTNEFNEAPKEPLWSKISVV